MYMKYIDLIFFLLFERIPDLTTIAEMASPFLKLLY